MKFVSLSISLPEEIRQKLDVCSKEQNKTVQEIVSDLIFVWTLDIELEQKELKRTQ